MRWFPSARTGTSATAEASIAARLTNTVAVLAPSDWGNPGFSGESRAE